MRHDVKIPSDEAARQTLAAEVAAHPVMTLAPADVDAWIDKNVQDLAAAREVLKLLLKAALLTRPRPSTGRT
jgi:hypothetical protein